jgi:hypothetical protein
VADAGSWRFRRSSSLSDIAAELRRTGKRLFDVLKILPVLTLALVVVSAPLPARAQSCSDEMGARRAKALADQCLEVSPATHPPCNAENSCALIQDEISRGCKLLGTDAPNWCGDSDDQ